MLAYNKANDVSQGENHMSKITNDEIIDRAMSLIKEKGLSSFSLRDLAKEVGIKAPSMYKHFKGIDDINKIIALRLSDELNTCLKKAIANKHRDDALIAIGETYRQFIEENTELYSILLSMPDFKNEQIDQAALDTASIIISVLNDYQFSPDQVVHLERMYKSIIHGFFALTHAGYMTHMEPSAKESDQASLQYYVYLVNALEKEAMNNDIKEK